MLSLKNFIINEAKSKKEEKQEGMTILDNVLNNQENENKEDIKKFVEDFIRPNGPTIYAFVTDKVKDAIKIGYTDQQPEKRIQQWKDADTSKVLEVSGVRQVGKTYLLN